MYLQYTPSSKRNLSSKILHKSPPINFLTLTYRKDKVAIFVCPYLHSGKKYR